MSLEASVYLNVRIFISSIPSFLKYYFPNDLLYDMETSKNKGSFNLLVLDTRLDRVHIYF